MKAIIACFLAAVLFVGLTACSSTQKPPEPTDPTSATVAPTRPQIPLSANPEDMTLNIDGLGYQLPCSMEFFMADGWIPAVTGMLDGDYEIPAGESRSVTMYKDSSAKSVFVYAYNPDDKPCTFNDSIIIGIDSEEDSSAHVLLSGGLELNDDLTGQMIFDLFGNSYDQEQGKDWYTFHFAGKGSYTFKIKDDRMVFWQIRASV